METLIPQSKLDELVKGCFSTIHSVDGKPLLVTDEKQLSSFVESVVRAYADTFPTSPDLLLAELHLLEEVCAFYANDEDEYLKGEGEPYGGIPTEVGLKARSARHRFVEREAQHPAEMNNELDAR
jgi:hypothetical protein